MPDIVDQATRSRMMAGIRAADTKPEMAVRRGLHRRGYRYRLHGAGLPGRPDIFFPGRRAAIFVNGCFWHGHDCRLFRLPDTRREFWRSKIDDNRRRDERNRAALNAAGWRHLTIWECALKGRRRIALNEVLDAIELWLANCEASGQIRGHDIVAG